MRFPKNELSAFLFPENCFLRGKACQGPGERSEEESEDSEEDIPLAQRKVARV
jgi:hypothetical protein